MAEKFRWSQKDKAAFARAREWLVGQTSTLCNIVGEFNSTNHLGLEAYYSCDPNGCSDWGMLRGHHPATEGDQRRAQRLIQLFMTGHPEATFGQSAFANPLTDEELQALAALSSGISVAVEPNLRVYTPYDWGVWEWDVGVIVKSYNLKPDFSHFRN